LINVKHECLLFLRVTCSALSTHLTSTTRLATLNQLVTNREINQRANGCLQSTFISAKCTMGLTVDCILPSRAQSECVFVYTDFFIYVLLVSGSLLYICSHLLFEEEGDTHNKRFQIFVIELKISLIHASLQSLTEIITKWKVTKTICHIPDTYFQPYLQEVMLSKNSTYSHF